MGLGPDPTPGAVGPAVTALEDERRQRRLAGDAFADDASHVVRMQDGPPVEGQTFLVADAQEFEIRLVGECPRAIQERHPHGDRCAVGDQAKPLLAFPQHLPGDRPVGDVDVRADEPQRLAGLVALDPGFRRYPANLTVAGTNDAVLGRISLRTTIQNIEKLAFGAPPVFRMQPSDPVLMRLVHRPGGQPMNGEIFRRAAIPHAIAQVHKDAADLRDPLNFREFAFALPQCLVGCRENAVQFKPTRPATHVRDLRSVRLTGVARFPFFGATLLRPRRAAKPLPLSGQKRLEQVFDAHQRGVAAEADGPMVSKAVAPINSARLSSDRHGGGTPMHRMPANAADLMPNGFRTKFELS